MGIVALSALDKVVNRVSMNAHKRFLLVAVETPPLEAETPATTQAVALCAFDTGDRWVVLERLELGGGIVADEEANLFAAALPYEGQPMFAGSRGQLGVEDVRERFSRFNRLPVKFKLPRRRRGDNTYLTRGKSRAIRGPHDLAGFVSPLGPSDAGNHQEQDDPPKGLYK